MFHLLMCRVLKLRLLCSEVFICFSTCYSHLKHNKSSKKNSADAISFSTCYSNVIILWKISADTQRWRQIYLHIWCSYPNNDGERAAVMWRVRDLIAGGSLGMEPPEKPQTGLWKNDDYNRFVSYMFAESNCNIEGLEHEGVGFRSNQTLTEWSLFQSWVTCDLRMLPFVNI